ncbi:MAG: hypothetical protein NVSMB24_04500 [Mucilaginibacter sp.]
MARAAATDTIVRKNGVLPNHNTYNITDDLTLFADVRTAFQHDSIQKGIHLLTTIFKGIEAQKKITRVMNYRELELYNILIGFDNGDLSTTERQLVEDFVRAAVNHPTQIVVNGLEARFKALPASAFSPRLKLYFITFKNNNLLEKEIDKVLKDKPNLFSANVFKAESLYDDNRYDESIKYCTKLVAISPQYARGFELRGNCYSELNKPQEAVNDFSEAIKLYPDNDVFYYERANEFINLDKYTESILDLRKVYAKNPAYKWTIYNLARSYYKIGMSDSSLYLVNMHIQQNPNDEDGYDLKGYLYYDRNSYPEAIDQYSQAIKLAPANGRFYEDRGNAYFYGEKYSDAVADFQKAVQLDKNRAYAHDRLGDCYYQLKEYQKAIAAHQQAVKINPSYKYAYVGLSMSKVELKDYQGAIADCKKAIAIDSTYATGLGDLGWAYYCNGDNDACIAYSYKALKYDEKATYAMFNIALATLRKGDAEKSKALYRQFIATCKEKNYTISDGAIDDLKDLMKKSSAAKEDCKFIIEHLFEKELKEN